MLATWLVAPWPSGHPPLCLRRFFLPSPAAVLLPHREDVKLEHVEASQHFLASFERREGLQACVVYTCDAPLLV